MHICTAKCNIRRGADLKGSRELARFRNAASISNTVAIQIRRLVNDTAHLYTRLRIEVHSCSTWQRCTGRPVSTWGRVHCRPTRCMCGLLFSPYRVMCMARNRARLIVQPYTQHFSRVGSKPLLEAELHILFGLRVERIDPLRFLAGCRKRRLNQALSVPSLSMVSECVFCCLLGLLLLFVLCQIAFICMCSAS